MKRTTVTTYKYDADGRHVETVVTVTEEDDGGTSAPNWSPNVWPYGGGTWGGWPYTVTYTSGVGEASARA